MANTTKTTIGKDAIESLTTGMYEDPKFVYREYIQNAADQIDKAVEMGILSEQKGYIEINIDSKQRRIVIEDNATGVEADEAVAILKHIAQSTKKRGIDKGFRGIGRLGGLGYCEELIFETSYQGEAVKTTMIWNARDLKNIINDRDNKEDASQVIDRVTDFDSESESKSEHYFRVTLTDVSNDELLNIDSVRKYLSMTAPVPFDLSLFSKFAHKIRNYVNQYDLRLDEYEIYINHEQLYKGYSENIKDSKNMKNIDKIEDIQFFRKTSNNNELLFWGWYGISKFEGTIKESNITRGIRLRKHNIQIGSESTLLKLHKNTERGNFYFIGEVHAVHEYLIPNGRRDYFSEYKALGIFETKLRDFFHTELYPLYYFASNVRSTQNKIVKYNKELESFNQKSEKGFTNEAEFDAAQQKVKDAERDADIAKITLEKLDTKAQNSSKRRLIFETITNGEPSERFDYPAKIETIVTPLINDEPVNDEIDSRGFILWTDKLTSLNEHEKHLVGEVFDIIIQKNLTVEEDVIENLKDKIIERYR